MMLFSIFFTLISLAYSGQFVCQQKECDIYPVASQTDIICPKDVKRCDIHCYGHKKCLFQNKVIRLWSGAHETRVFCHGKDACVGIEIYIGSLTKLKNLPDNFNHNAFIGEKKGAKIEFIGPTSGKEAKIYVEGLFIGGDECEFSQIGGVVVKASETDSFDNAEYYCEADGLCILQCGTDACTESKYTCFKPGCLCRDIQDIEQEKEELEYGETTQKPSKEGMCPRIKLIHEPIIHACRDINGFVRQQKISNNNDQTNNNILTYNDNNNNNNNNNYSNINKDKEIRLGGIIIATIVLFICIGLYWFVCKNKCCKKKETIEEFYLQNDEEDSFGTFR